MRGAAAFEFMPYAYMGYICGFLHGYSVYGATPRDYAWGWGWVMVVMYGGGEQP